jgi:hypothetical protein
MSSVIIVPRNRMRYPRQFCNTNCNVGHPLTEFFQYSTSLWTVQIQPCLYGHYPPKHVSRYVLLHYIKIQQYLQLITLSFLLLLLFYLILDPLIQKPENI